MRGRSVCHFCFARENALPRDSMCLRSPGKRLETPPLRDDNRPLFVRGHFMLMKPSQHGRAHAIAVAVNVQIVAWAAVMFLMVAHIAVPPVLLTAQSLLMVATIWYAVYLYGKR